MNKEMELTECNRCAEEITEKESDYHGGLCRDCHTEIMESQLDRIEGRDKNRALDDIRRRRYLR